MCFIKKDCVFISVSKASWFVCVVRNILWRNLRSKSHLIWSLLAAPLTLTSSIGQRKFCVTWSSREVLKQEEHNFSEIIIQMHPRSVLCSLGRKQTELLSVASRRKDFFSRRLLIQKEEAFSPIYQSILQINFRF